MPRRGTVILVIMLGSARPKMRLFIELFEFALGGVQNFFVLFVGNKSDEVAIVSIAAFGQIESEVNHTFLRGEVDIEAPWVGDDVAQHVVLLVVGNLGATVDLGGMDVVLYEKHGKCQIFCRCIKQLDIHIGGEKITIIDARVHHHGHLGRFVEDVVDTVVKTGSRGEDEVILAL